MKHLILAGLIASSSWALADNSGNVLRNGDFSSGLAEWEGDVHTADSGSDDSGATTGVVVKMRGDWTKVTQDFDGDKGTYLFKITYTATPDLTLSTKPDDYQNVPGKVDFSRLGAFDGYPGEWVIIVNDLGAMHYNYWEIKPKTGAGVQTVEEQVTLDSDSSEKKGFYLLFPPGTGTINIQSISMTPIAGGAAPSN